MGRFRLYVIQLLRHDNIPTTSGSKSHADTSSEWHRRVKPIAPAKPDRRSQNSGEPKKHRSASGQMPDVRPHRRAVQAHVVLDS